MLGPNHCSSFLSTPSSITLIKLKSCNYLLSHQIQLHTYLITAYLLTFLGVLSTDLQVGDNAVERLRTELKTIPKMVAYVFSFRTKAALTTATFLETVCGVHYDSKATTIHIYRANPKQPLNKAENSSMQHKPSYKVVVY